MIYLRGMHYLCFGHGRVPSNIYRFDLQQKYYVIGRDKKRTFWRVLKIDRLECSELNINEDSTTYTENECSDLLKRLDEGNKITGGLKLVTTCYGIIGMLCCHTAMFGHIQITDANIIFFFVSFEDFIWVFLLNLGFVRFLEPYYMLLITKRKKIGEICGHKIYAITKSEMIPIPNPTVRTLMAYSKNENRSFVHSNVIIPWILSRPNEVALGSLFSILCFHLL